MSTPLARQTFPELYERALVAPLFRPFAEHLVDTVRPVPGERVLDVACGTGIVARLCAERVGDAGVVGVDVAAPMLAVARSVAPGVDWREGNAVALPLRDGEAFDVVTCQQGLQFVPDRPAVARELRRALGPGGRLAVSTWCSDEELPVLHALRRVAERHLGAIVDRRHALGDATALEALLRDAGFDEVRSTRVTRRVRFDDGAYYAWMNGLALLGMSAGSAGLDEEARRGVVDAIVRDRADVVRHATDAGGFAFTMATNVATARG